MRRIPGTLAAGLAGFLLIAVLAGYAGRWSPACEIASAFRLHLALLAGATGLGFGLVKLRQSAGLALLAALIAAAGLGPAPRRRGRRRRPPTDRALRQSLGPQPPATGTGGGAARA